MVFKFFPPAPCTSTTDSETSQVVGTIISENLSTELSEEFSQNLPEKFDIVFQFLNELNEQYERQKKVAVDKLFHVFLLAIKEPYKNRNIANNLLENNLKLASQEGFTVAIAEATGKMRKDFSWKSMLKLW